MATPCARWGRPSSAPPRESAYFLSINRNKKSVALDLETPEGREVFHDLCRVADVVWENFRPGVMARLGCAPETLRRLNPRLVVCSISAFGQEGPYREWPAFDLALQAMGGAMSLTGEAGRAPARMGLPMGDLAGGMFGALAVAERPVPPRSRPARGRTSTSPCWTARCRCSRTSPSTSGRTAACRAASGSGHASVVPYQAFATRDGHVVVAVFAEKFWAGFCRAIDAPGPRRRPALRFEPEAGASGATSWSRCSRPSSRRARPRSGSPGCSGRACRRRRSTRSTRS